MPLPEGFQPDARAAALPAGFEPDSKPDFVAHAEIPTVEQLKAAETPQEKVALLKQTPVGQDLNAVISLYHSWVTNGPHAVVEGLKDLYAGNFAKGGHEVIGGAGMTALPMVAGPAVGAALANPAGAAAVAGGGYLGSKAAALLANMVGATPDQQALAGDVGGIGGAVAGDVGQQAVRQLPLRQMATAGLDATSAALDNPIVGIISPRAKNVGQALGRTADAMRVEVKPKTLSDALTLVANTAKQAGVQLKADDALRAAKSVVDGKTVDEALSAVPNRLQAAARERVTPAPVVRSDISDAAVPIRPAAEPPPAPVSAPVTAQASISPQMALNQIGLAARRAKVDMTLPEAQALIKTVQGGVPAEQAVAEFASAKDPAAALAKMMGTPNDAEVRAAFQKRYAKGEIKDYAGRAKP